MRKNYLAALFVACILFIISCNKKQVPQHTDSNTGAAKSTSAVAATKPVVKTIPASIPKVIVVNDSVAKKNIDGRLNYDLNGHRYWRNYNDGKYYLFNKSMYSDSAFIPH